MQDIFSRPVCDALLTRINKISADDKPRWGKMNAAQMLAHCCKPYDTLFDAEYIRNNPPPNAVVRVFVKLVAKPMVVGPKPYPRNGRTAPSFIVADQRDLMREREKLVAYINKVQGLGRAHFEGKQSHSFGKLSAQEWNVLFYKHLDHHLQQFGV